jgi:hypothetical protein
MQNKINCLFHVLHTHIYIYNEFKCNTNPDTTDNNILFKSGTHWHWSPTYTTQNIFHFMFSLQLAMIEKNQDTMKYTLL